MANGHGGARTGCGRKKMTEVKKQLYGKVPVKSKEKILQCAELIPDYCPEPHAYMSMATKNAGENLSKQIYSEIYGWLKNRKCEHLVQPQLIEQYALSYARYAQAETAIHQFGLLSKNQNSGNAEPSPFIDISQTYLKQSQSIWLSIYATIKDTCGQYSGEDSPEDDLMEKLLSGKL
jgi:hypothetical protein